MAQAVLVAFISATDWLEVKKPMATDIKLSRYNVWFDSTCCHHPLPPPPGHTLGDLLSLFFYCTGRSIPYPRYAKRGNSPPRDSLVVTQRTHTKGKQRGFLHTKIKIAIFISVQNIPETLPEHSTSTPRPMFHYNPRFSCFVRWYRYSYSFRTLLL